MIVYDKIISLLNKYDISYKEYSHFPILTYEDAEREKQNFSWEGVESKNVFLTNKAGKYFLFVTVQGEKLDFKFLKSLTGEKLSIASAEEVENIALCVPGCVSPFGLNEDIFTIIDEKVFTFDNYLFSPGITTKTIQLKPGDLKQIFEDLKNKIFLSLDI